MKLQSLNMYRWGNEPLKGTIKFSDKDDNEITLRLSEEKCNEVLKVVADQLVETSKEQAAALTANIIENTGRLELE